MKRQPTRLHEQAARRSGLWQRQAHKKILDAMDKGDQVDDIYRAVKLLHIHSPK
jgi:hypothetical protein